MFIQHVGHIKIGETVRGIPSLLKKIRLTTLYKNDSDNFLVYPNTKKDGYDKLKVKLPFVTNVKLNYSIGEISFIKINDFYKYMAYIVEDKIYLEPYQPDFQDPVNELPTIVLENTEKWKKNLAFEARSILYFIVIDEEGNEIGLFDFKTKSAHTIQSIKNNFKLLEKVPAKILASLDMELVIFRKIFETEKNSEVSYLDFVIPSFTEMVGVKNKEIYNFISDEDISFRSDIENEIVKDKKEKIKNAISVEKAKEFFAGKFSITLDTNENLEFADLKQLTPPQDKKRNRDVEEEVENEDVGFVSVKGKKSNREILREFKEEVKKLREKGVDLILARKFVLRYRSDSVKKAKSLNYDSLKMEKII